MPLKKGKKKKAGGGTRAKAADDHVEPTPLMAAVVEDDNAAATGYVPSSVRGCYISGTGDPEVDGWLWGLEDLDDDLEEDDMPEIAFDPESGMLSAVNIQAYPQSFTISVRGRAATTAKGRLGPLQAGTTTDESGKTYPCITFMTVVPGCTILDLCKLRSSAVRPTDIDSDIQKLVPHPDPELKPLAHHRKLTFPLQSPGKAGAGGGAEGASLATGAPVDVAAAPSAAADAASMDHEIHATQAECDALAAQITALQAQLDTKRAHLQTLLDKRKAAEGGDGKGQEKEKEADSAAHHLDPHQASASPLLSSPPTNAGAGRSVCTTAAAPDRWLCTQGQGTAFTHYFAGNHHAVDFRTAEGAVVVSATDGVVTNVSVGNTVTGVHVSNYFKWNSVTVAIAGGGVAEYVHLEHDSAFVKEGDTVRAGDPLARAGGVGFCPEQHLHFQLLASGDSKAASVPFTFGSADGAEFVPVGGRWYGPAGECDAPGK